MTIRLKKFDYDVLVRVRLMQLQGFNNLTKSLAITLYKVAYVNTATERERYNQNIASQYSAEQLSLKLAKYANSIGGQILNQALKDYQPQGASVTLMIAEEINEQIENASAASVVNHIDKSHICIHTYPEEKFANNIAIFRADIEISTCGLISPLRIINDLIDDFQPDLMNLDYRVRGFNRIAGRRKQYLDHELSSIQQFISTEHLATYQSKEMNLKEINLFHCSYLRKSITNKAISDYCKNTLSSAEQAQVETQLVTELKEIYHYK